MFLTEWVLPPALNIFTFYAYFKVFTWLFKTLKLPCKTRAISEARSNTPTKCWKDSHLNVRNRSTNCNEWFNLEYHTFRRGNSSNKRLWFCLEWPSTVWGHVRIRFRVFSSWDLTPLLKAFLNLRRRNSKFFMHRFYYCLHRIYCPCRI